jgi:peptide/nickel transport system ATP-binding protein
VLEVRNLSVSFGTGDARVAVTRDVSFSIAAGERVGMVGESGCGKTVTGLSILGLLPAASSTIQGEVLFEGRDLAKMAAPELRGIRGREIAMVFQEPMTSLNPVLHGRRARSARRCGAHDRTRRAGARERAIEAARIASASRRPGAPARRRIRTSSRRHAPARDDRDGAGLRAEAADRRRADHGAGRDGAGADPRTCCASCSERAGTAMLFITHDLGVVAETCSRLLTMYAGELVEDSPIDDALLRPRHPYTSGLLRSLPRLTPRRQPLPSIPGACRRPHACRRAAGSASAASMQTGSAHRSRS